MKNSIGLQRCRLQEGIHVKLCTACSEVTAKSHSLGAQDQPVMDLALNVLISVTSREYSLSRPLSNLVAGESSAAG